jgi:aarF domain-containing kinase
MDTTGPTLAELIDALPKGLEEAESSASARAQLEQLLGGRQEKSIPTGQFARAWSLGTLQAKLAAAYAAWWLRSGFQDAEQKRRGLDETHVAAALQVLDRMTYLRGAVMKVGQVLAHWPDVLPAPFVEVLGRLHSQAPPMHFALLREQARRELGADPTEIFDDFETEAFAAASLGQVHRARLKGTGERVAVKIQYPDIARTIRDDLRNLSAAGFGMRLSGDWENLKRQFEGIQRMLEQETDYEQEAQFQEAARRRLADLDEIVVPRVHLQHSSRRVLTTDYLEGSHLEPFLATRPSQELRDRHGSQITRASMRLWYGERLVYADPHPGNYLFLPDGRLGLLDFGCCHRFSEKEFEYVLEVERAAFSADENRVTAALAEGCDLRPEDFTPERMGMMRAYCDWLWGPIRTHQAFDYGAPDQYREGIRLYGEFIKRRWTRSQPVNVWLNKVFFGVRAMLTHLGARVEYGNIMREESPV